MSQKLNSYVLVMNTTVSGLQWRYEFTDSSDIGALDLIKRTLHPDSLPRSCMSVTLWNVTDDKNGKKVAEFKLAEPTIVLK